MVAAEAILEISNSISLGADTPVHSNECRLSPQSSMIYIKRSMKTWNYYDRIVSDIAFVYPNIHEKYLQHIFLITLEDSYIKQLHFTVIKTRFFDTKTS